MHRTATPIGRKTKTLVTNQLLGLSDALATNRTISVPDGTLESQVNNLIAGASYQVQAYTIFKEKESLAYTSRNFTTSKLASHASLGL